MLYDVVAVFFTKSHTGTSEHGVCSHGTARVSRKGNGGDSSRSSTIIRLYDYRLQNQEKTIINRDEQVLNKNKFKIRYRRRVQKKLFLKIGTMNTKNIRL